MTEIGDDKFWKSSTTGSFNFDDDQDVSNAASLNHQLFDSGTDSVFNLVLEENIVLPIHSVISKRGLDSILQDTNLPLQVNVPLVEETIKKLYLGIPCMLDCYRTLEQKLELLDKAVDTFDGNVILKIVLFLKNTLQTKLLHYYLSKRKIALQHYCLYLAHESNYDELCMIYMSVGNSSDIINLFYSPCKSYSSKNRLLAQLNKFIAEYSTSVVSNFERSVLLDFQKFTSWQLKKNMTSTSVIEQLAILYKNKYEKGVSDDVTDLKSLMKVNSFQYDWVELNTMCSLGVWDKLTETFIKSNLFKKNVINTDINVEIILNALHKHGAPVKILHDFLLCLSDNEKSLYLGKKFHCHRFVIDKLIESRDKAGLIQYKKCLPPQSEDFFYLEKNL